MKRDMELVRFILQQIETKDPGFAASWERPDNHTDEEFYEHVKLLKDAGFLEADVHPTNMGTVIAIPKRLTWEGHELLAAIKNDTVWKKVKEIVKEKGGIIPFEILKALAVKVAGSLFGISG
jgi:hypothetical protein